MEKKYWFPRKPPECGWGWGVPLTWQGRVLCAACCALLAAATVPLAPVHRGLFFAFVALLSAGQLLICRRSGEPPRRREP